MSELKIGNKAPDFESIDQKGNKVKLSHFLGKKVILYFYPKDNTPGCTAEACNLRDNYHSLTESGFVVIGVSPDSIKSHVNFSSKFELPFILLSDTEKDILMKYKAWGEKKMYGKAYMGVLRKTFVIDENGLIELIIEKVNTKDHFAQIVEELKKIK